MAEQIWRRLTDRERESLVAAGNVADDWNSVLVSECFDPSLLSANRFSGECRLAVSGRGEVVRGNLRLPVGISNSRLLDCTVGKGCAVHDVRFLSGYEIGERCLLFNIGQMTSRGEFPGPTVEVMNEKGTRRVAAFPGMTCSDAYLMAKYADDSDLQRRLAEFSAAVRFRPAVGVGSMIANVPYIDSLRCGECCSIDCAVQLESLCLCSTEEEPVFISGSSVLRDGIVGAGSRIDGCIAEHFSVGVNCRLSGGVRFFNSVLGDNSTASCCEMVSNLIFPAHEQHHNNSFLIASCIGGQSNVAAGATIGSNHNGRTADGELRAGRGFWPGLCVSLKHSSNFACSVMIAKGSYPAELDIRLPFSLVNNNVHDGRLEVIPAFAWMYNMYALVRNNSKYQARDRRKDRHQNIEFDAFAPDSMQEVLDAIRSLEQWAEEFGGWKPDLPFPEEIVLPGGKIEKSRRPAVILKAARARESYREMLLHYAAKNLLAHYSENGAMPDFGDMDPAPGRWTNLGGQIVPERDVDCLRDDVRSGKLNSWKEVHSRLDSLWLAYPESKMNHAASLLRAAFGWIPDRQGISELLSEERRILELISARARQSREKDFLDPFRAVTYRCPEEMMAVAGNVGDDASLKSLRSGVSVLLRCISDYLEQ